MFFELLALKKSLKTESFTEEKSNRLYENILMLFIIIYILCALMLWVRVMLSAFKCGRVEGVSSVVFPSLYYIYKFGDLIKLSCNQL